ncbi:hypothetical protein MUK42_37321 [Musa troglodytarum]|nr:hypothetical protein MUK42_37321 [Musa troglodytarum]
MVVSSVGLVRCGRSSWYQFLLYCFLLSGCTLVALSFGAHKSSPRFPAPSILDQALAARSRRPALYSGDCRLPLYRCFYYLCCVLALYMYALCLWF